MLYFIVTLFRQFVLVSTLHGPVGQDNEHISGIYYYEKLAAEKLNQTIFGGNLS